MPRAESHRPAALRRREALLRAAVELAAEEGIGGVSHRAIAARAGVAPSNTTYFFDSIDDLIAEAIRVYSAERSDELAQFDRQRLAGATPAEVFEAYAELLTSKADQFSLAGFEAMLYAARNPSMRPVAGEVTALSEKITAETLRRAGSNRPEADARAFIALADGFILHRLANPRDDDEQQLRRALMALAIVSSMDDDELADAYERLGAEPPVG